MKRSNSLLIITLLLLSGILYSQPEAPTGLKAEIKSWNGMKYVLLTWDEETSASVRFAIYKKEGILSDTNPFIKLPMLVDHNSFKDKMVMWGETYCYYVTAIDLNLESSSSDSIEITIVDTLRNANISGTLTDEVTGLPLNGGRVNLIPSFGWHYQPIQVDSNGYFSANVAPGNYFVHFKSPEHWPEFYNNAPSIFNATKVELMENSSTTINAALRPIGLRANFNLSGKVTDENGNPLNAFVSAVILNHNGFIRNISVNKTDSAGTYNIHVKYGDSVVVYARPSDKGFLPEFYNDKLEFSEADKILITGDTTDINFILAQRPVYNNSISGKITDLDGKPVVATVTLFRLKDENHHKTKRTMLTDSLGNYNFTNLNPGNYIFLTIPEYGFLPTFFRYDGVQTVKWREADSIVVTETSIVENINVNVSPIPDSGYGTIRGRVVTNANVEVSGALILLVDENLNIVAFANTDITGSFKIDNVAAGNYTVITDKFNYTGSMVENVTIDYNSNLSKSVSLTASPLSTTRVDKAEERIDSYELSQNYPNPFNPSTIIKFQIPQTGFVSLKVYNVIGQEVATLVNRMMEAGSYYINFTGTALNSGIYFYTLSAGNKLITHKMTLIK